MQAEDIRLMRMARQHLLHPVSMQQVVCDLCGVQAQFLNNAMHALRIRSSDFDPEKAQKTLLKNWTLRGTMHVFSPEDLPVLLHEGRSHFLRPCDTMEEDETVSKERKELFAELIIEQIKQGINEREALKAVCTANGMTEAEEHSLFNAWGGLIRALCESGCICHVVQEKKAFQLCPPFEPMQKEKAELELARRYFTHYGPATIRDAAYFFDTTHKQVKTWLDQLPVQSVICHDLTYYFLPCDEMVTAMPDCVFLTGFDPLMQGYEKKESLFLPQAHLRGIFNLAGIVMPAVLLHGQVVGRWKKNAKLMVTMFEDICDRERRIIEDQVRFLWGEGVQITIS